MLDRKKKSPGNESDDKVNGNIEKVPDVGHAVWHFIYDIINM